MTKLCKNCNEKPTASVRSPYCTDCRKLITKRVRKRYNKKYRKLYNKKHRAKRQERYYKKYPEKLRQRAQRWRESHIEYLRNWNLKKLYNISDTEYLKILELQGGVCAICKRPPESGKHLCVDHCHKTGKLRGLLCTKCNRNLFQFEEYFEATVEYLKIDAGGYD